MSTTYGPVAIGMSVTISSNFLPAPHLAENTGNSAVENTASCPGSFRSKRTVRASTATALAMPANPTVYSGDDCGLVIRLKL